MVELQGGGQVGQRLRCPSRFSLGRLPFALITVPEMKMIKAMAPILKAFIVFSKAAVATLARIYHGFVHVVRLLFLGHPNREAG